MLGDALARPVPGTRTATRTSPLGDHRRGIVLNSATAGASLELVERGRRRGPRIPGRAFSSANITQRPLDFRPGPSAATLGQSSARLHGCPCGQDLVGGEDHIDRFERETDHPSFLSEG